MMLKAIPLLVLLFASSAFAQAPSSNYAPPQMAPQDPMASIAMEISSISRSVATLSQRMKEFVDKFEKVGGISLSEKQQRFVMGLEVLVRTEQRIVTLQRGMAELTEKQISTRSRLTQIELDLRPQSIERTTQLQGSPDTVEIRENRKEKLLAEQRSLNQLIQQLDRSITELDYVLREAQSHAARLRRSLLPQIEKEIEGSAF